MISRPYVKRRIMEKKKKGESEKGKKNKAKTAYQQIQFFLLL